MDFFKWVVSPNKPCTARCVCKLDRAKRTAEIMVQGSWYSIMVQGTSTRLQNGIGDFSGRSMPYSLISGQFPGLLIIGNDTGPYTFAIALPPYVGKFPIFNTMPWGTGRGQDEGMI